MAVPFCLSLYLYFPTYHSLHSLFISPFLSPCHKLFIFIPTPLTNKSCYHWFWAAGANLFTKHFSTLHSLLSCLLAPAPVFWALSSPYLFFPFGRNSLGLSPRLCLPAFHLLQSSFLCTGCHPTYQASCIFPALLPMSHSTSNAAMAPVRSARPAASTASGEGNASDREGQQLLALTFNAQTQIKRGSLRPELLLQWKVLICLRL